MTGAVEMQPCFPGGMFGIISVGAKGALLSATPAGTPGVPHMGNRLLCRGLLDFFGGIPSGFGFIFITVLFWDQLFPIYKQQS